VAHVFHFFLLAPPAATGQVRSLEPGDARRVARVLRLRDGEPVTVADCAGAVFAAQVRGAGVEILSALPSPPAPPLAVRLALGGTRAEVALEKLVELGVERIGPLRTAGAPRPARLDRWRRVARAAAEQAKRPRLAVLGEPLDLADALAPGAIVLSHEEPDGGLDAALAAAPRPVTLLVGPESGFTAEELAAARAAGVPVATLGPLVLRSETAAIVGAALALDRLGALAGLG
jgi:16S rRNA (uracil1498-N3)-methyltransferase